MVITDKALQKKILLRYGLTLPQMEILINAARKFSYAGSRLKPEERHDGKVSEYGVKSESITKLRKLGFIADVLKFPNQEERHTDASNKIQEAWEIAREHQPGDILPDGVTAWDVVRGLLTAADEIHTENEEEVTRITLEGRKAVWDYFRTLDLDTTDVAEIPLKVTA